MNKNKKSEDIKYITIKELENKNTQGVLVLESSYFQVIKIVLEKDLEEREREIEIEEQLENRIADYDPMEYIEKEISLYETSEDEEIAVILLKREILYSLLEKAKKNSVEILGIIPNFLLSLKIEKESDYEVFIYIEDEKITGTIFKGGELKELTSIDIERETFFYEEVEEILERLTFDELEEIKVVHLEEKDSEFKEKFAPYVKVIIDNWKDFPDLFDESYSFLPYEYKDRLQKKKDIKILGVFFLISFLIEFGISFFFNAREEKSRENISALQNEIGIYTEKIEINRKRIEEFKDFKAKTEELTEKMGFSSVKMSFLLSEVEKCKRDNMIYSTIEYLSEENILKITGETVEEKDIIEFEKSILQRKVFTYLNHDYIKQGENSYLFQFDIGVKDETNN